MGIQDGNGKEIVSLPGIWEVLAKFAFAASVPILLLGISWAVWVTNSIHTHSTSIAIMQDHIAWLKLRREASTKVGNVVNAPFEPKNELE